PTQTQTQTATATPTQTTTATSTPPSEGEFVCNINCGDDDPVAPVEDYNSLIEWENGTDENLTLSNILVFSGITVTKQIGDGVGVTGQDSGAMGVVVHCNPIGGNNQVLIKSITGTFTAGEQVCKTGDCANGNITLANPLQSSDPKVVIARCYDDDGILYQTTDNTLNAITDANHYRKITVPEGERHDGIISSNVGFQLNGNGQSAKMIVMDENYMVVEWIRLTNWTYRTGIISWTSYIYNTIQNCLIYNASPSNANAAGILVNNPTTIVSNCIIANLSVSTSTNLFGIRSIRGNYYNNTIYNIYNSGSGKAYGIGGGSTTTPPLIKNNIITNSKTADYAGNFSASCEYNADEDGTAPGTNAQHNVSASNIYVSVTSGSEDLHMKSTADGNYEGTDLSAIFTNDIDNQTRSDWDKGADEYVE
ncbi:hypothetical protein KKB18_06370, partial [bacterium]|nr:hypothetical protein [bacterium]